ncbi:ABC transporter ATP-binding protein [Halorubellus sp. JP-L1]|uniref:ABC transporter ATP-binding protein n=1 Tax=Halorubellus sp. JP-L1 TaxID=2715753 RepID=UPI00196311D6|nr:ATP-binding cassette domain-containing protein [Halorubellus sp. JP-L1]
MSLDDATTDRSTDDAGAPPRLVGEDIVTGYGSSEILHGISVRSHDGVTCIFGPNGSGKSTLIKALNGKLDLWEGTRRIGDRDCSDASASDMVKSGVVTVPQDGGLFPSMTVHENLLVGGHTVDDGQVVRDRIEDAIDAFPALEEKLDAKAQSLSGGQQMMVSFARAMVTGADILLLDEPSAGLQPSLVSDLMDRIVGLTEHGVQVVLVEQNVTSAMRIADHVYILAQGEKQFDGVTEDLSEEDELIEVYLGLG